MLNLTKISAVLLTLSLTTAATAEEVSLESLISNLLSQSVAGVQQELNNNIQGAVLTAANQLTLSLAATGEEVSLEGLISNLLSQSVAGVQQELNNNIQGAVLTAANQFNLVEEATYATKTSITDLHSDVTATATANATAAAE